MDSRRWGSNVVLIVGTTSKSSHSLYSRPDGHLSAGTNYKASTRKVDAPRSTVTNTSDILMSTLIIKREHVEIDTSKKNGGPIVCVDRLRFSRRGDALVLARL